jgi:hypothetical protein
MQPSPQQQRQQQPASSSSSGQAQGEEEEEEEEETARSAQLTCVAGPLCFGGDKIVEEVRRTSYNC